MPKFKISLFAALLFSSTAALAQYKYVAPDGAVTYSDRPPPADAKIAVSGKVGTTGTSGAGVSQGGDELPFSVKQAASKYPIVLYTAPECGPCGTIRQHLFKRGVPYAEKQIRNIADTTAFKALGFSEMSFPAISIGTQKQNGFEATALDTLLDAAGYPKAAKLPATYQAKVEPLTPETASKTTVRVADASGVEKKDDKGNLRPKREAKTQPEPIKKEPTIRF